jgi:vitamin B12 transporter
LEGIAEGGAPDDVATAVREMEKGQSEGFGYFHVNFDKQISLRYARQGGNVLVMRNGSIVGVSAWIIVALALSVSGILLSSVASADPVPSNATGAQTVGNILDTVVVTTNVAGESRLRSPSSIWVIDEEDIKKEHVASVAELIANYSVGMVAESGGPSQSFIKLRGAQTNGQGRDWLGYVLILINGRRSGTGNLSKISTQDIQRVEILKGPSSVMYGSQAIGGVVNIILKNSRTSEGGAVEARGGSFGLFTGHAEYAGKFGGSFSAMASATYSKRDSYKAGRGSSGTQGNSNYERRSGLISLGWQPNQDMTLSLDYYSDGVYHAGFSGSGAGQINKDSRSGGSADLIFDYSPEDSWFNLTVHNYFVEDFDDFDWTYQLNPDLNKRKQYILGSKIQPVFFLGKTNDLRIGLDLERTRLNSYRTRLGADGTKIAAQAAPYDNNQIETVTAFYAEDTQRLFDGRLLVRAGVRHTLTKLELLATPYLPGLVPGTRSFNHTNWSIGANFAATDFLNFRAGASTGFKSPSASQLAGEVQTGASTNISVAHGNPDLKPEINLQYELGLIAYGRGWYADLVWFKNTITDRIDGAFWYSETVGNQNFTHNRYINNPGDVIVEGLELDGRVRIHDLVDLGNWNLTFGFMGTYNLKSEDLGETNNTGPYATKVACVYDWQGTLFAQFGQSEAVSFPWSARVSAVIRGPMYNNTGERMLIPEFEPNSNYVHKKHSFTVINISADVKLTENVTLFGGVNNVLNVNDHPFWWGIDKDPYRNMTNFGAPTAGSRSMPGIELYGGVKLSF